MSDPARWEFGSVNRFTAGAMGETGDRVFYFQVFADGLEINLKCEKQQAAALSDHLIALLDDLPEGVDPSTVGPTEALPPDALAWIVGSISIGVDRPRRQIVVLLEQIETDEPTAEAPGRLRVSLSAEQVHGFAAQIGVLTAASRPICRLCDRPIDPSGHACPRLN